MSKSDHRRLFVLWVGKEWLLFERNNVELGVRLTVDVGDAIIEVDEGLILFITFRVLFKC